MLKHGFARFNPALRGVKVVLDLAQDLRNLQELVVQQVFGIGEKFRVRAFSVEVLVGGCEGKQVFHKGEGAALDVFQAELELGGRLLQKHAIFGEDQMKEIGSVR